MYPVHGVHPKETVSCEGLVILMLETINVMRPWRHHSREGTFRSKVMPGQLHKVSGAVAELLGCGNHVDALIQELAHLVLGESVLAHGDQDRYPHHSLLRICWYCL